MLEDLAVLAIKRLLEDDTGPKGKLNIDKMFCALLQQQNTIDRDCGLSLEEILFGFLLRDILPQLKNLS